MIFKEWWSNTALIEKDFNWIFFLVYLFQKEKVCVLCFLKKDFAQFIELEIEALLSVPPLFKYSRFSCLTCYYDCMRNFKM